MRKILCIVLAFMIVCTYATYIYADDLENLQSQQQDLQNQLNESNNELNEVQSQLSENLQQIEKLDERIQKSEEEVDKLNNEISSLETDINDIKSKLEVAETNYEKQKNIMEKRLISIYEAGETRYIDVLLKSRDISEFLSNYYLITQITALDKELLDEVSQKKKYIDLSKQKLEKNQEKLKISITKSK